MATENNHMKINDVIIENTARWSKIEIKKSKILTPDAKCVCPYWVDRPSTRWVGVDESALGVKLLLIKSNASLDCMTQSHWEHGKLEYQSTFQLHEWTNTM